MDNSTEPPRLNRAAAAGGRVEVEPLADAWSFSGSRNGESRLSTTFALCAAIALHASFVLIKAERPAQALVEHVIELETYVPEEEDTPAPEPPAPEQAPVEVTDQAIPTNDPTTPERVNDTLVGDPAIDAEPGLPEEDLAAPLLTDGAGDSAWAMLSGHGTSLGQGGLGRPGRGSGGQARSLTLKARDLSRAAVPPHLAPIVIRNYPVAAKIARVEGTVTVSALIAPDGNPTDVRVVNVTPRGRGFGETCTRTVHEGPDWKPQLNRDGRPVTARVNYTCRFTLPKDLAISAEVPTTGAGANRVWTKPAGG